MQPSSPTSDDFDWSPDNPDLVTERQPAIAVYENAGGSVTIRQERDFDEEQDPVIVVTKTHVPDLVRALVRVAGVELPTQLLLPPPTSRRKRHADGKGGETPLTVSPSLFTGA